MSLKDEIKAVIIKDIKKQSRTAFLDAEEPQELGAFGTHIEVEGPLSIESLAAAVAKHIESKQ
jgi:hypothetical protein